MFFIDYNMKAIMQKSTYTNIVKNKILIVGKIILDRKGQIKHFSKTNRMIKFNN